MRYPCELCGRKFERSTGSRAKLCEKCWKKANQVKTKAYHLKLKQQGK